MAPALRKATQTIVQRDATLGAVAAPGVTKHWAALDSVPFTVTSSFEPVVQVSGRASAPVESPAAHKSGLSNTDKGVIVGCVISVAFLLLLLCWCYLRRVKPPPWASRFSVAKVPPKPQDLPPEPTPPNPAAADNPSKAKKRVTIAADLPRYLGSKYSKSRISPLVRISTDINFGTGLATRTRSTGQSVRFFIRQREKPKMRRRPRSHKRRKKSKAAKTNGTA
ncbi:hypothetical protein N7475_006482 [Penicillium sp. IBT 31633x]|nr:hypothetical protein N7475_006482 [Penicillium sp. IBT 31633x]